MHIASGDHAVLGEPSVELAPEVAGLLPIGRVVGGRGSRGRRGPDGPGWRGRRQSRRRRPSRWGRPPGCGGKARPELPQVASSGSASANPSPEVAPVTAELYQPTLVLMSVLFMPQATTLRRASPGPGSGHRHVAPHLEHLGAAPADQQRRPHRLGKGDAGGPRSSPRSPVGGVGHRSPLGRSPTIRRWGVEVLIVWEEVGHHLLHPGRSVGQVDRGLRLGLEPVGVAQVLVERAPVPPAHLVTGGRAPS